MAAFLIGQPELLGRPERSGRSDPHLDGGFNAAAQKFFITALRASASGDDQMQPADADVYFGKVLRDAAKGTRLSRAQAVKTYFRL